MPIMPVQADLAPGARSPRVDSGRLGDIGNRWRRWNILAGDVARNRGCVGGRMWRQFWTPGVPRAEEHHPRGGRDRLPPSVELGDAADDAVAPLLGDAHEVLRLAAVLIQ